MNLGIGHGVLFAVDVNSLSEDEVDRLIGMAWEDRTPFEAIEVQFGLKENQVRAFMRRHLKPGSFRRWRARVKGRSTKHARIRGFSTGRFRSASQRRS
ncbi:MAG: TIGR03643 family protein [Bacteroidota bacterium]|nr:TIGR03643 family protein [Bacteroidota bacterium]